MKRKVKSSASDSHSNLVPMRSRSACTMPSPARSMGTPGIHSVVSTWLGLGVGVGLGLGLGLGLGFDSGQGQGSGPGSG